MKLSIVVTYHQEGFDFINECITQMLSTIDVDDFEIIIVDDGSIKNPLDPSWFKDSRIRCIKKPVNKGVGQAFDTGVEAAQSENIILSACDIRFIANHWASQMIEEIEKYPKSFMCTSCINLNEERPENKDLNLRKKISVVNGATILVYHDQKSNPRMTPSFRGILEAQWLKSLKDRNIDSFDIPCILGAFYGVKKQWYQYCDGWYFHKSWGTLEPWISLKSHFFGGSCRTAPRIEIGHIFKKVGWHGTTQDALMYNKMVIATLLFENYPKLIGFLGSNPIVERARVLYNNDLPKILEKKMEYKSKTVMSAEDFCRKWNIDLRE